MIIVDAGHLEDGDQLTQFKVEGSPETASRQLSSADLWNLYNTLTGQKSSQREVTFEGVDDQSV